MMINVVSKDKYRKLLNIFRVASLYWNNVQNNVGSGLPEKILKITKIIFAKIQKFNVRIVVFLRSHRRRISITIACRVF
jgi:hypothetical protein